MTKINLAERNDMALSIQAEQYKESIVQDMEQNKEENIALSPNEIAKREIASELIQQGFSEEAICRILNLTPDKLPETLPF